MPRDPSASGHSRLPGPLALPNDDPRKIVAVAVILCLVCSVMVSSAAVLLKPQQERNQALAIKSEIVKVAGLQSDGADVEQLFGQIETRIVDLDTGEYVDTIDPASFNPQAAAKDPATSIALAPADDIARIKRRALYAPVYLVRRDDKLETLILPVYGKGLWSTMQGFLALAGDGRTIKGLTFYEQGETPGLGDEIVNPQWQQQFKGKSAFDEQGQPRIHLIKGTVQESSPDAKYQVDGIAGATLTSNGVTHLLQYWLSDAGFGPYLKRLQSSGGNG
jgi:Na+-transporting NADH:ubiquinone oxidoreductase subunit C